MKTRKPKIRAFAEALVNGPGGLKDCQDREAVDLHPDPYVAGAIWAMRCLANRDCEGARYALNRIVERHIGVKK